MPQQFKRESSIPTLKRVARMNGSHVTPDTIDLYAISSSFSSGPTIVDSTVENSSAAAHTVSGVPNSSKKRRTTSKKDILNHEHIIPSVNSSSGSSVISVVSSSTATSSAFSYYGGSGESSSSGNSLSSIKTPSDPTTLPPISSLLSTCSSDADYRFYYTPIPKTSATDVTQDGGGGLSAIDQASIITAITNKGKKVQHVKLPSKKKSVAAAAIASATAITTSSTSQKQAKNSNKKKANNNSVDKKVLNNINNNNKKLKVIFMPMIPYYFHHEQFGIEACMLQLESQKRSNTYYYM